MLYRIQQKEIWDIYTEIEANSPEEAESKVRDGEGVQVHSEYSYTGEIVNTEKVGD